MSTRIPVPARLGSTPDEYARLGLSRDHIAPFEDGMRTDGGRGTFEWWYFDARLSDGSTLVVGFYTKDPNQQDSPLAPCADVKLDRPDGTHLSAETGVFAKDFSASKERCDVRIGPNRFAGDLSRYEIHVETEAITVDVTLTGTVPSWRPETGHFLFEEDEHLYFAWLPSVPQGRVEATITVGGVTQQLTGSGYHDHNWGNCSMMKVMNDWYWGRGQAGPYTVIACMITAAERFGYRQLPIFMLARDGRIVADDGTRVTFTQSGVQTDEATGKPVGDLLVYEYGGDPGYTVTWRRQKTILRDRFVDDLHGLQYLLARLVGFDGAYLRFTGELTVQESEGGQVVATERAEAIWEEMYFGKAHPPG